MVEQQDRARREQILTTVEAEGVRFVNLEFTDVVGMAKCVTIPVEQFPDCLAQRKWFDGSAIEGFARVAESDMYLFPDLSTFAIVPGKVRPQAATRTAHQELTDQFSDGDVVARMICDVRTPDGEAFDGDPRATLLRALDVALSMGYGFLAAPELEFFLLRLEDKTPAPLPHDRGGYFDLSTDLAATVRRQMVEALQQMGIRIEASHHEVAAGQHELDFETSDALRIADGLMTAKYVLKAIAAQHDLYATFLPKPFYGENGSGMHTHQQLISLTTGQNAFVDEQGEYGLSDTGRYFIAGQLAHAHAMCAILAPLVNSYKRLVPGYEAPVFINWGRVNREALIRVPRPGRDRQLTARIELRCCDPSCNPYLALAVMLRAGLDGIDRELPLADPIEELDAHGEGEDIAEQLANPLPATLGEALEELEWDPVVREGLGQPVVERFLAAKESEWLAYSQHISRWELDRYLDSA